MRDADTKLIDLLRANAREPTASLARKLGLARSTVQERLARLEREGIVKGYTVRLAEDAKGNRLRAVVMIETDPKQADRVSVELRKMPEVRSLAAVVGKLRSCGPGGDRYHRAHRCVARPHRPRAGVARTVSFDHPVGEVLALRAPSSAANACRNSVSCAANCCAGSTMPSLASMRSRASMSAGMGETGTMCTASSTCRSWAAALPPPCPP